MSPWTCFWTTGPRAACAHAVTLAELSVARRGAITRSAGVTVPERIQQKRTRGWRKPPNTVSVARPSRFGNPFRVGAVARVVVIDRYGDFAVDVPVENIYPFIPTVAEIRTLAGKNLMCFCPLDQPCHADVLLELANA